MKRLKKKLLWLLRYGGYFFAPGRTSHFFGHMPMSLGRAAWNTALNRAAFRKVESGFFRDNLIVVIGPGKSGSRNLGRSICVLDEAYGPAAQPWRRPFRGWTLGRYMTDNGELQIEIIIDIIDGGILHTHASPSFRSLRVLAELGSKYVILGRHPLHQLVSRYTQCLSEVASHSADTLPRILMDGTFPISSAIFDGNKNTDEVIRYLICDGYLDAHLFWYASWLKLRDPERSIVVRLEDLKDPSGAGFERLSQFLYGRKAEPDVLRGCLEALDQRSDMRRRQIGAFHFPRGWTRSEEGIVAYVSDENISLYKEVVSRFVETHAIGKRLVEVFPEVDGDWLVRTAESEEIGP